MPIQYHIKTFSELTPNELYDILRLRQIVFVEEQQCIYVDCDNKDQRSDHIMGYLDGELVICCRLIPKGVSYPDFVSFGRLVNSKKTRGQGEGVKIINMAITELQKKYPGEPIKICAQHTLLKYYESIGFKAIGDVFMDEGLLHISMIYQKQS